MPGSCHESPPPNCRCWILTILVFGPCLGCHRCFVFCCVSLHFVSFCCILFPFVAFCYNVRWSIGNTWPFCTRSSFGNLATNAWKLRLLAYPLGFGRFPVCFGCRVNAGIRNLKDQNHSIFSQCQRVYLRSMGFRVWCVPPAPQGVRIVEWCPLYSGGIRLILDDFLWVLAAE